MALVELSMAAVPQHQEQVTPCAAALTAADLAFVSGASTPSMQASPIPPLVRPFDESAVSTASSSARATPLRKGKWTPEEEAFTSRIIHDFTNGYLPLAPGTTLRSYLSEKLNCDPMRITKKFAGAACIGKQVFQPCEQTPENAARITEAEGARAAAERLFLSRLEHSKCPRKSAFAGLSMVQYEYQTKEMASLTFLASSETLGARPSFLKPRPETADSVMSDAAAGGLLLDFFAAVRRRAGDDKEDKMSTQSESDDSEGERRNDRKRAHSMSDIGTVAPPVDGLEDATSPRDEIKRTKSLSDIELTSEERRTHAEALTTCA